MDAKLELAEKLCGMFPESVGWILETLAEYEVTRVHDGRQRTMAEQVAAFLAARRVDGLSSKTLKNYRDMLGAFAARVDMPAGTVTVGDLRGYICYLAEGRRLKSSSIQTHINTLRSFFTWLVDEEIIVKNPMRRIKSLRLDRAASRHPLTAEELEQLRLGCKTDKEKALVEFLVSSGCRLSEVAGISVEQIDWKRRSVTVRGKGNKERTVYFSVRAKLMLETYLAGRKGGAALFSGSRAPYAPMTPRAIQKAVQDPLKVL